MAVTAVDIGTLIESTPGYVGGRPRIAGTSIAVASIALLSNAGRIPAEIVSDVYPQLTLAQVHAALAFYHANRQAVDDRIADDERFFEQGARETMNQR
jgi:uncharacterized protein (DUF433 family)